MINDTERFQWLISLSEKNLDEMPDWEWPKIKAELLQYLLPWAGEGMIRQILLADENSGAISRETVIETQGEVKRVLLTIASASAQLSGLPTNSLALAYHDIPLNLTLRIISANPLDEFRCQYEGPLRDRVFMALGNILASGHVRRSQLRLCPECKRIFLLRRKPDPKKQYFCSSRCSSKASSRAYYQKMKGEKAEEVKSKKRERSHRQYKEKIRQKHGPNVKVARRPRNG